MTGHLRLRRWIIGLGLVLIAAFVGSSAYDAWRLHEQITEATERELTNLARALSEEAERSLQAVDLLLTDTALWYQGAGRTLDDAAIATALASRANATPYVSVLTLVDAQGMQRHRSRLAPGPLAQVADRPYFIAQRDQKLTGLFINPPLITRTESRISLVASRRLERDGRFDGVVTASVTLEDLREVYDAIDMGAHSSLLLIFDDGRLVVRHPMDPRVAVNKHFPEIVALKNQPVGRRISPVDGRQKFVAAHAVAQRPLILAVTRDVEEGLRPWREEMVSMVLRNIALTLVGLLTIVMLTRQLKRVDAGERALRQSEERYALAMEAANEGHAEWNVVDDSLFASERWRRLHGMADSESPQRLADLLPMIELEPGDLLAGSAAVQQHLAGRAAEVEIEYRVKVDGQWRWIHMRGRCRRDAQGRPLRFYCAASDVSPRKQAEAERLQMEAQLRQSQHMEALGTLAGGIAHDFNNVLGAILGHGEMAQRDALEGSALRRHLDRVMQAGARARLLVRRILDFSRSSVRERELVPLQAAVDEALLLLAPGLPASVQLRAELNGGRAAVLGDPTQIHQLVSNLCTNAVGAMPDGGTLTVSLEILTPEHALRLSHGSAGPDALACLSVADTGTGITPEVQARMFDPFFSTKTVGEGTGLGLSVVHNIVADLGGAIDVQTEPGRGSRFALWLPLAGELESAATESSGALPIGRGQAVMVVDDETALLESMEEMLARLGYEPVGFASAEDALQAFAEDPQRFDAVLTDETMPGLSGTELAARLQALRPNLPVLVMSGFCSDQLDARLRSVGVHALLHKPLAMRDVAEALAMLWPQQRA